MTDLRELAELRELVSIIADWKLPETGETWPSGGPVSYATMFGSLGVRDYMRNIATKALAILDAEGDGGADDPVAVIGRDWQLLYVGADPIASIVKRHGLRIGSNLYARPTRSGGVSDADVDGAMQAYIDESGIEDTRSGDYLPIDKEAMRAALTHFVKGTEVGGDAEDAARWRALKCAEAPMVTVTGSQLARGIRPGDFPVPWDWPITSKTRVRMIIIDTARKGECHD